MITEAQQQRLNELQQQEEDGNLNVVERNELNALVRLVEATETQMLGRGTEHVRNERLQIQAQNAALKTLLARKERLVRRLERFLELSRTENAAIQNQLSEIVGPASAGANSSGVSLSSDSRSENCTASGAAIAGCAKLIPAGS